MAHKLMEQKLQARKEKEIEGNKRKWENFQSGNNSRGNYKDNSRHQQNNQKQGNARAMTTASSEGVERLGTSRGHTRNHCPKKNKPQGGNANGRAYMIKDADKQWSYGYGTNTVLRGCTLNLLNHLFEIDLIHIKLGMFDVIIGMDWFAERDAVIVCGKKVVCIPCGNKTLIVVGDKGPSRLKVIYCIKARKYIERGCQMFVAYVTEKKSENRLEDVLVIRDFPEVFPDDLSRLPPPKQIEFKIDLVPGAAPVAHVPYHLAPSKMKELSVKL
ncbi:putative reverse transcriptase domain-containing protein [Tanacetum coccineum]